MKKTLNFLGGGTPQRDFRKEVRGGLNNTLLGGVIYG